MVIKKTNTSDAPHTKIHLHTQISSKTKKRWDNFILNSHGTLKGTYGSELERALNQYIDSYLAVPTSNEKIQNNTVSTLRKIASGFRDLPTYPLTQGLIVISTIKHSGHLKDSRTIRKYAKIVNQYSKDKIVKGELPSFDVSGFCAYVDRLANNTKVK